MKNKPNFFIGSSKEGLYIANQIVNKLQNVYRVTIWNKNFFELNISTYDNLIRRAVLFDFAIIILSNDDNAIIRKNKYCVPRDNTIYELGLFTGILGKNRVFFVCEQGIKLPSDLLGITCIMYDSINDISDIVMQIDEIVKKEMQISRIQLLPSTTIAYTYYTNFIAPICSYLNRNHKKLFIIVPNQITSNIKEFVEYFIMRYDLQQVIISGENRDYIIYKSDNDNFIDIPTSLNASYAIAKLHMESNYIGDSDDFKAVIERELDNFCTTLELLISSSYLSKYICKIISEDEFANNIRDIC
ncbi:TIR domain-containing protein [Thomasclavelia saccharogumia]|uniref:TIR domain-containing protein n=1 Tax=Thomasclavelia saccharogumia TaxID=341225 RepID=UPI00068E7C8B|nr:TIR domain-containing protein [Thomasclavelia saccharogumia]